MGTRVTVYEKRALDRAFLALWHRVEITVARASSQPQNAPLTGKQWDPLAGVGSSINHVPGASSEGARHD